jgi:DNA-binding transcriptional MerR regulator
VTAATSPRAAGALAPEEPARAAGRAAGGREPWPQGVSRSPSMNIGAVLGILKQEFPAVTVSKVRFLEDQGLVAPQRTPSGYRRFSQADVERLRFALAAQRDSFMPLRIIRERLAELDAGVGETMAPAARVVSADGEPVGRRLPARLRTSELADATGASIEEIATLTGAGLISQDAGGRYDSSAVQIVAVAGALHQHGIDARHLRSIRSAADRQVDLVAQLTAPVRAQAANANRERARAMAQEISVLCGELHTALVRAGVDRLNR